MFDALDGLKLVGPINVLAGVTRTIDLRGELETPGGASVELRYSGPTGELQAWKQVLEPQVRAATDKEFEVSFTLVFDEPGLSMAGDDPEKLTEKLTKFTSVTAWVQASASTASSP